MIYSVCFPLILVATRLVSYGADDQEDDEREVEEDEEFGIDQMEVREMHAIII